MTRITALLGVLGVALATSWPSAGNASDAPLEVLKDLRSVEIAVIGIVPDMERQGLSERQLLDDIERQLRRTRLLVQHAGSNALTAAGIGNPTLMITPKCRQASSGREFCLVTVELREPVSLARDPGRRFIAPTWRSQWIGEVGRYGELRDQIGSMVDQFVQDLNRAF